MIYLDTSVALAHLLADRRPPPELWEEELVSSRLLEYEYRALHPKLRDQILGEQVPII